MCHSIAQRRVNDGAPTDEPGRHLANAFVLATPDYHGSMSGAMKNSSITTTANSPAKLFGYLCTSHEKGLTPMSHMRSAVRHATLELALRLCIHPDEDFTPRTTQKPRLVSRLAMLGRDLSFMADDLEQFQRDLASTEQETSGQISLRMYNRGMRRLAMAESAAIGLSGWSVIHHFYFNTRQLGGRPICLSSPKYIVGQLRSLRYLFLLCTRFMRNADESAGSSL